jgi:antitoxin component YwqK of YwqJK toxin-antitoxin module
MNPVPFILLAISLPLLLGGCGEKEPTVEPVAEVQPVEEKVLEVKEEVTTEEAIAKTKPKLEGVNVEGFEEREGIFYLKGSEEPYSGKAFRLIEGEGLGLENYKNGKEHGLYEYWPNWFDGVYRKEGEINYKDGKAHGLSVSWYRNGQKESVSNIKDDKANGLTVWWHENGQKGYEVTYKDDEIVEGSEKFWNSKGEPVDSLEEAEAE